MTAPDSLSIVRRTWESELLDSVEEFSLASTQDGYRLSGKTLIVHDGIRVEIQYEVDVDPDWSTLQASVSIPALAKSHQVTVNHGQRWRIDGERRAEFDGCVDIDLGWTPATNTLPIRRLDLPVGTSSTIRAVWLKWSELIFMPAEQTYTRHDRDRWTFQSGDFTADLLVDEHGVVLSYGEPPIWRAVP